ncbi:GNAT family N-acetyltransferase [Lactobacillus sp. CC-MHH1034]|uniref:GNAT family N-acetyltransferase n=1 Tax=Agrilactobacillus fermenti TaxID=2586909 RepID=UPI001E4FBE11|nr:GNAT family N-acetyltransferase [Agrilactobacillus fermenti]MCD2256982.1 GNAT family N-acetyltransferase [Agrilactobacillus fermenti]
MESFEKYHPIMTPHYTLDWLTTFTVKEVFQLRQDQTLAQATRRQTDSTLTDTVHYISQTMREVMGNHKLLWGIQDRKSTTFLGTFTFENFNADENSVEVSYELLPQFQHQGIMSEILTHMTRFAFDELNLSQLKAITYKDQSDSSALLEKVGFRVREDLAILDHDPQVKPEDLVVYDMTRAVPFK